MMLGNPSHADANERRVRAPRQRRARRARRARRWLVTFMNLDLGHISTNDRFVPVDASIPPEAA